MAANTTPIWPLTPKNTVVAISSATTGLTVSGVTGLTLLMSGGTNGSEIESIRIKGTGTTSACAVRLWMYLGSGNALLLQEFEDPGTTPSVGTTAAFEYLKTYSRTDPLYVPSGSSLYVSTHVAQQYNVHCNWGDY